MALESQIYDHLTQNRKLHQTVVTGGTTNTVFLNRAYLNFWIWGSRTKVIFSEKILNWVLSLMLISQKTILTRRVQR